jgi:hypothetical protein
LARLLTTIRKIFRQIAVKENDGFADRQANFSAAEAQDVDTRFPGKFAGWAAQCRDRVGQPGAVHVNANPKPPGQRS